MVTKDKNYCTFKVMRILAMYNEYNRSNYSSNFKFPIIIGATNGNHHHSAYLPNLFVPLHTPPYTSAHLLKPLHASPCSTAAPLCTSPHTSTNIHTHLNKPPHTPLSNPLCTSMHPTMPLHASLCMNMIG